MKIWTRRLTSALASVVVAAIIVGSGWAAVRPDDRAGVRGIGASSAQPAVPQAFRPDDRAGLRGPASAAPAATALSLSSSDDGWSWSGVAAGTAFVALVGILGGALVWFGRYQRRAY